jgi:hypothetical protein
MAPKTKAPAAAAGGGKKRAQADAPVSDCKVRDEAERFASRVALHLREAADSSGWDEDRVKHAFAETVRNMPPGALQARPHAPSCLLPRICQLSQSQLQTLWL